MHPPSNAGLEQIHGRRRNAPARVALRLSAIGPVLACALLLGPGAAAVAPPPAEPADVKKLITDLADDDVAVRKSAAGKLESLGEAALPALRRVGKEHADVDVRLRAFVLIAAIERKLYGVVRRYEGTTAGVIAFALSPDGKRMVSGTWDNTEQVARVWDVETGKELFALKGHTSAIVTVAWSNDGSRILTGSHDRTLRLWDAKTGKWLKTLGAHASTVHNVVFTLDGKKAVSCSFERTIRVWSTETGELLARNDDHGASVRGLAMMPGGKRVASAGFDGTVRVIDVATGRQVLRCDGTHPGGAWFVAVAPDGKRLASSGADNLVRLWDAQTGKLLKVFKGHGSNGLHAIAYSHDGRRVLSGGNDNTGRLWDVASGKEVQRLEHAGSLTCVAFLPGDGRAVTASSDKLLRLWRLRE
jgi:WD40 repeat protein